jgi:hypothetical protein
MSMMRHDSSHRVQTQNVLHTRCPQSKKLRMKIRTQVSESSARPLTDLNFRATFEAPLIRQCARCWIGSRPAIAGALLTGGSRSKMTILKLQCFSCAYSSVQDTRRDPKGAMLEICRDVHQQTYKDHKLQILELSRDELEMMVVSKHPMFRRKQAPSYFDENHIETRSPIFEIMADLKQMERDDLEDLWMEYGSKR